MASTQTRPAISRSSPATSSPSVTSTIASTEAAASDRLGRLARLADVAAGQRALGHHAGQGAVVVDDRHELEVLARHRQPDAADGLAVAGRREALAHHVAHAQHDVGQELGLLGAGALQHPARSAR